MAKDSAVPDVTRSPAKPELKAAAKPEAKAAAKPDAKDKAGAGAPAAEAPRPSKSRRILRYAMLGLLLVVGAGAFALQYHVDTAEVPGAEAPKPPQFVALEPLTVNLRADGSPDHYLQLGLTFEVAGSAAADAMKLHMPVIRSNILLLLTSKSSADLGSPEGKAKLSRELLAAARKPLPGEDSAKGLSAVHYSAFIIQ